jgi:hypothetical protein
MSLSRREVDPNTFIAVKIHSINVRNKCLVSSDEVKGAILCVDCRDRNCRHDIRRNRIGGHGAQLPRSI